MFLIYTEKIHLSLVHDNGIRGQQQYIQTFVYKYISALICNYEESISWYLVLQNHEDFLPNDINHITQKLPTT